MKTYYKYVIKDALLFLISAFMLTSCLDNGEETIALEEGNVDELIYGCWRLEESRLYNEQTGLYESDLINDKANSVWVLEKNGSGVVYQGETQGEFSWSFSGEQGNYILNFNENAYEIFSLSSQKLVLQTMYVSTEGQAFLLRLIFVKYDSFLDAKKEIDEDVTHIVSSSESSFFKRLGYGITVPYGSVPKNSSGQDGKVAFSVQRVGSNELPTTLPESYNLVDGTSIKIEPMNFLFSSPLTIKVPLQGKNSNKVALLRYNDYTNSWDLIPFTSINNDGTATVTVIELGYFILVEMPEAENFGGVHIKREYLSDDYIYYLTLTPVNNTSTETKRISFSADGKDVYMANVPLGSYTVTVSREFRKTLGEPSSKIEVYGGSGSTIKISTPLSRGNSGFDTYTGWYEFKLDGSNWSTGRPDVWGEETVTYGTGKFQATLTWVNNSVGATDYDLHLFGESDNTHVYYSNKNDGPFELDRDWLTESGNAIENIYTVNNIVAAQKYTVKVHHYLGTLSRRYNCRIIIDGRVVKSVTGAISTNKSYNEIYSFIVE